MYLKYVHLSDSFNHSLPEMMYLWWLQVVWCVATLLHNWKWCFNLFSANHELNIPWIYVVYAMNVCWFLSWIQFGYVSGWGVLFGPQNPPTPADSRGSASEEELPAARAKKSLQAARARSKKTWKKKQEARSNYRQQAARSKKQEARKQQAAGRQVRELVFLSIQKATLGRRLEDSSES